MILDDVLFVLTGDIRGTLLAVGDREVLALQVDTVLADLASDSIDVRFDAAPADAAELPLQVHALGPAVGDGVPDDIGCDGGTGRHDGLEAAIMDHEVTDGTDASLTYQAPQHVRAVVAVRRLVERLFGKEVTVSILIVFCRYVP